MDTFIECSRDEFICALKSILDPWVFHLITDDDLFMVAITCKRGNLFNLNKAIECVEHRALQCASDKGLKINHAD